METKGLTFIVSDKCNISCDFCAPECSPKLKGNLVATQMKKIYDEAAELFRIDVVVFTGGEPTLFLKEIIPTMTHIRRSDRTVGVRIVTNGYWGKTDALASKTLDNLVAAGLSELNVSVDDFHQFFLPLEWIKTATEAALARKIPVLLAHKTYPGSLTNRATFEELMGQSICELEDCSSSDSDRPLLLFSSGDTIPVGRGTKNIDFDQWVPKDTPDSRWAGPCNQVLKDLTISSDGRLSPCCGLVDRSLPEFYSQNVTEVGLAKALANANNSVLYNWLALEGPSGIKDYIEETEPRLKFAGRYLQNCQLCQEIFEDPIKKGVVKAGLKEKLHSISMKRVGFEVARRCISEK